ncbi:MAG: hypothetical protein ACR2P2_19315 [Nakamurella sp.]
MTPDDDRLDPRAAAALMAQTTDHTRRSLDVSRPRLYVAWGVAWLAGLGVMWLSVRGQHPYRGPAGYSAALLGILIIAALAVTMEVVLRATKGGQGHSEVQGRMYGLSWAVGFAAFFVTDGAVAHYGASAQVLGILGAAGPLLITSLMYVLGAALWLDWSMFAMGCWLAMVTAVGAWTGPVAVLAIEAFAGGGGFLLMACYLGYRRRR